ncbi:sensor histidine kinase [Georhizobium profundi]|uniref:histidine kinase n=2 Tax=Georhizobium profundi TaxID=2341112 RepID=A0A3Q8XQ12_9HYPH|nr:sensor histidine kinase [Georhizobium profundi]
MHSRVATMIGRAASACINEALNEGPEMDAQVKMMRVLLTSALAAPLLLLPLVALLAAPAVALPAAIIASAILLSAAAMLGVTGSRRLGAVTLGALVAGAALAGAMVDTTGTELSVVVCALFGAMLPVLVLGFRNVDGSSREREIAPVDDFALAAHMSGFVALLDEQGALLRAGGHELGDFAEWIDVNRPRGLIERIHVSDRLPFMQALDRIRLGGARERLMVRLHRAAMDRQFVHVSIDLSPRLLATGEVGDIIAHMRVVDEEIELHAECTRLVDLAEQAEGEKTRFLAAVSHEMRTPLNAVIGFSEILAREYFAPLADERQREYVGLIKRSGEHLLSLVNTMLDMSKIENGRYRLIHEDFDVAAAVDDCVKMLGLEAEDKGLTLTARARRAGLLNADQRAVQQILINLIGNAIKFTEPGGVITVDATRSGAMIRLTVSDTGIGMPPEILSRVGEPFVQGDEGYARRHQGTGLGLCLVKGLASLHGGRVVIDSVIGRGTAVTVELPAEGVDSTERQADNSARMVEFPPRLNTREKKTINAGKVHETTAKTA